MSEEDRASYHAAPHTLDSQREIDEDAPPSAGHDEQMAEGVRERDQSFTEAVQEESERVAEHGEVGPGDPTLEKDEEGRPVERDEDESDEDRERREQAEEQRQTEEQTQAEQAPPEARSRRGRSKADQPPEA